MNRRLDIYSDDGILASIIDRNEPEVDVASLRPQYPEVKFITVCLEVAPGKFVRAITLYL